MSSCECHDTYGAHLRAKRLHVAYCRSAKNFDFTDEKAKEKELALYKDARAQGVQPATTKTKDIRAALDMSDRAGCAYDASNGSYKGAS